MCWLKNRLAMTLIDLLGQVVGMKRLDEIGRTTILTDGGDKKALYSNLSYP